MKIKCCRYCEKRYVGCHAECETYLTEKAIHDKLAHDKRKDDQARFYANDCVRERLSIRAGVAQERRRWKLK